MHASQIRVLSISMFILVLAGATSGASVRADEELARFYYDGMWDRRDRLRSGVVTVSEARASSTVPIAESEHEYLIAFDHDLKRLRHDHRYGARHVQWARTPTECLLHVAGTYCLTRDPPDNPIVVDGAQPFDLRMLGVITYGEFDYRFSYDDYRKFLDAQELIECVLQEDGLARLTWSYKVGTIQDVRRTIWIDEERDFAPVRMEVRTLPPGETDWPNAKVAYDSALEWARMDDSWVPTHLVLRELDTDSRYEYTLHWQSANRPVPETFFQPEGFALPDRTGVFNARFDPPLLEWTAGVEMPKLAQRDEAGAARLRWIVGVSAVFACILAGVLAFRYRRALRG